MGQRIGNVATTLLVLLIVAACAALLGLFFVVFGWKHVQYFYQEAWGKGIVDTVNFLTLGVGIGGTYAAVDKKESWMPPAVAGVLALSLTKAVQIVGDWQAKRMLASLQLDAQEWHDKLKLAMAEGINRTRLLTALRDPIRRKYRRVRKEVDRCVLRQEGASIKHMRRALSGKAHLDHLLFTLGAYLLEQLPAGVRDEHQVRVGLYLSENGVMRPAYGVNTRDPEYNPFTSYREHEPYFQLDAPSRVSHTVRCVLEKKLLIVPDCEEAKERGELVFFNASQPSYLKSLAACYVGTVCGKHGEQCEAALVVDADKPGFFKHEDHAALKFVLDDFACRAALELSLIALGTIKGRTHAKDADATGTDGQGEEAGPEDEGIAQRQ